MRLLYCGSILTFLVIVCGLAVSALIAAVLSNRSKSTLEFAIVVTRHGSRTPIKLRGHYYEKYEQRYFKDGLGVLTSKGKWQMFQLGETLRKHYGDLFSDGLYKEKDIYVRTTHVARTYMSAAALLAGLFPPIREQIWNPNLKWQPIPIWPDTKYDHCRIAVAPKYCPRFAVEQSEVFKKKGSILEEHRNLVDYFQNHTEIQFKTIFDFIVAWDPLDCMLQDNLPLPDWAKPDYVEELKNIIPEAYKDTSTGTFTMNRLLSGELIKDFNSWFIQKVSGMATEKMLLHSAHDVTIIGLLSAVGFERTMLVEPASAVVFELHHSQSARHVEMYFYNNTIERYQLYMPKCEHPCSLEDFLNFTKDFEVTDWKTECNTLE